MNRYVFRPKALKDLDKIRAYLMPLNPIAAVEVMQDIFRLCQMLADHPTFGRISGKYRRYSASPYVIQYHAIRGAIEITRVVDGRQDLTKILR